MPFLGGSIIALDEENVSVTEAQIMMSLFGLVAHLFYSVRLKAAANTSRQLLQKLRMQRLAEKRAANRRRAETPQASVMIEYVVIAALATITASDTESEPATIDVNTKELDTIMTEYCRIFEARFQNFPDPMELIRIAYARKVEVVLVDLLHNILKELYRHSYDHYFLLNNKWRH